MFSTIFGGIKSDILPQFVTKEGDKTNIFGLQKRLMKRGHSLHLVNLTEVFVKALDAVTFPIVLGLQRCEYSKQLQECMKSLQ